MRRAKLAPGSVPQGSLPTASSHAIPRCFVCDEPIKSHRLSTSLLAGRTQYTHSPLPTKIGGYIGDEFVVVVTPQDALCKHCMALINTMDRLELELRQHRYTLTQHLKTKYKLDKFASKQINQNEVGDDDEDIEEPEVIDVSDEEWTPNKKQRTEAVKHHRCTICNASYTNLSLFMAHLSRHKQVDKPKLTAAAIPIWTKPSLKNNTRDNLAQDITFKCGCCSQSFSSKESLALHMHVHTGPQPKTKILSIPSTELRKPISYTNVNRPVPETFVQASALFDDIEQLSQTDISSTSGVCLEEQKGRVCLLALLNNGVCSDVTHRAQEEYQTSSVNTIVSSISKVRNPNEQHSISITVSIPNVDNGSQSTDQQHSFSTISGNPNSSNISYPLSLPKQLVAENFSTNSSSSQPEEVLKKQEVNKSGSSCQNFTISHNSGLDSGSLDMPDLLDNSFQHVQEVSIESIHTSSNPSACGSGNEKETVCRWNTSISDVNLRKSVLDMPLVPSNRSVQDMPSLLDEDLIGSEEKSPENFVQISEVKHLKRDEAKIHAQSECKSNSSVSQDQEEANALVKAKVSSPVRNDKDVSDSIENVAIISVASVQMNRHNFDAEAIAADWFYSSQSKDSPIDPDLREIKEVNSSIQDTWLSDGNNLQISEKNVPSETFTSSKYATSNDSCIASGDIIGEESEATEEQETSKISSLV